MIIFIIPRIYPWLYSDCDISSWICMYCLKLYLLYLIIIVLRVTGKISLFLGDNDIFFALFHLQCIYLLSCAFLVIASNTLNLNYIFCFKTRTVHFRLLYTNNDYIFNKTICLWTTKKKPVVFIFSDRFWYLLMYLLVYFEIIKV
jgi:hypothetical protein